MNATKIIGRRVVTEDGHVLGSVRDLTVDTGGWHVEGLYVKVERQHLQTVGVRVPKFGTMRVLLPTDIVSGTADEVVLTQNLADLDLGEHEAEEIAEEDAPSS